MTDLLCVDGLSKRYPQFSLHDVSFCVPAGSIMGFIGANGAGKTTTIKAILGMIHRDGGSIRLFGEDFDGQNPATKELLGVVMDEPFYVDEWSLLDVERAVAPFYPSWDGTEYRACLSRFGLDARKKVKELSRGMKVKLMLAVALSHGARLLLLDEPTSGLDPVARDELMDLLRLFIAEENRAILFSTHITSDLERIADYITFIKDGTPLFTGEKDALLEAYTLVRGGPEELSAALRSRLLGLREHSVGFEGLLPVSEARLLPPGTLCEAPSLEEIMVFLSKEGKTL